VCVCVCVCMYVCVCVCVRTLVGKSYENLTRVLAVSLVEMVGVYLCQFSACF
jgi:hypothetical protein